MSNPPPIVVVPQVFVWSKQPDVRQRSVVDAILGTREWPGAVRTTAQFLRNYRDVSIRAGEPLDLADYLAREETVAATSVRATTPAFARICWASFVFGSPTVIASKIPSSEALAFSASAVCKAKRRRD